MGKQPAGVGLRIYEGGEMNTLIEISCPNCGKKLIVQMKLCKNSKSELTEFFEAIKGKYYTFNGEKICDCRYVVMPTLIISAYKGTL